MLETLLKIIPFTPILYWVFSKTFRMAKKRKFYSNQISILEDYINNFYKKESIEFSLRDLKARQVTCNDWVGAKFLDYAIEKKCPHIFGAVHDFDTAWMLVELKKLNNGELKLISKYKEKTLKIFFLTIVVSYFLFGSILFLNKVFLMALNIANLNPIIINASFYNFIFYMSIFFIIVSAILLLSIGKWISALLSLSKKLPVEFGIN